MYHIDWCKIATTKLNDVATLGSCRVCFFYGNGFNRFQGKQMKVLTAAALASSPMPFFVLVWKSLKTSTTLTSSLGQPCCSKFWIIMLFIKSLIVFCGLPLVLLLFTLHMSFYLYLYKGKSNNKTQPSLTNICSWTT